MDLKEMKVKYLELGAQVTYKTAIFLRQKKALAEARQAMEKTEVEIVKLGGEYFGAMQAFREAGGNLGEDEDKILGLGEVNEDDDTDD